MSIEDILRNKHRDLVKKLEGICGVYCYWHTNFTASTLQSIVDEISEIEKELSK